MVESAVKAIAGFLNTDGGTLPIGVGNSTRNLTEIQLAQYVRDHWG